MFFFVADHFPCSWDSCFNLNKIEGEKKEPHKVLGFGGAADIKWRHSRRGNAGLVLYYIPALFSGKSHPCATLGVAFCYF